MSDEEDRTAVVFLRGYISPENGARLIRHLELIHAGTIQLRIDSPGGDFGTSIALYQAVATHPARVVAEISGLAASGASLVAMAADEILMDARAEVMIHRPSSTPAGSAEWRAMLRRGGELMAEAYAHRVARPASEVLAWMDKERVFLAPEALDIGFVDGVRIGSRILRRSPEMEQKSGAEARRREGRGGTPCRVLPSVPALFRDPQSAAAAMAMVGSSTGEAGATMKHSSSETPHG